MITLSKIWKNDYAALNHIFINTFQQCAIIIFNNMINLTNLDVDEQQKNY